MIIICFEIWSPTCMEQAFGAMMSSRLLQRLVWGPNRQLLFQRHRLLKRKVGLMHWSKGGLYWKIMLKPSSNLWVKPRVLRTYWTPFVLSYFTIKKIQNMGKEYLKGLATLVDFTLFYIKERTFGTLFAFLQTNPLLKRGKNLLQGAPFRIDPFQKGGKNSYHI